MVNVIEQISNSSFLYLRPWFYNNELALRCELGFGNDDEYMDNAFGRAIQIANILFENQKVDAAFYHQYFYNEASGQNGGIFLLNIDKTVDLDRKMLLDLDEIDDDISSVKRHISYDVDFFALELILKSQIECQINPLVSFVSLYNECIFSVYDDRGCDIVFFSKDKYKEFYLKLDKYLLEYDREKMKKTFDSI